MITAVAVVPTTPLALVGMPGRAHEGIAAIAAAAGRATSDLVGVDVVIAIAGGSAPGVVSPPPTDLLGYGLHLPGHDLTAGPSALVDRLRGAVGSAVEGSAVEGSAVEGSAVDGLAVEADLAVLARWAPVDVPSIGVVVPADAPPALVRALAASIVELAETRRVGVLVAGDLGAGHGPKPPRPDTAGASAALQDLVVAALDSGRPADLVRLDPVLVAASAARGVSALRVLGHLLRAARIGTVIRAAAAPLGVGYVVAQGG